MRRSAMLFALGLSVAGCGEETALLVFIDSDLPLDRVEVEVAGAGGFMAPTAISTGFPDAERPILLTLVPAAGHPIGEDIEIELKGFYTGDAEPAVERTAVTRFAGGEQRFLQLYLYRACAGIECVMEGETCVANDDSVVGECSAETVTAQSYADDPAPIPPRPPPSCDASCWHVCPDEAGPCEVPVDLALGATHSCALTDAGHVYCWGDGADGQVGHTVAGDRPARVPGLEDVTSLAAGVAHTCVSDANGDAFCWGRGMETQLGRSIEPDGRLEPMKPNGLAAADRVASVSAGPYQTCLLVDAASGPREVRCFGLNAHGAAGADPAGTLQHDASVAVTDVYDALDVGVGLDHACAMVDEGATHEVVCWGWASRGRLGNDRTTDYDELTGQPVLGEGGHLQNVIELAVGEQSSCALVDDDGDLDDGSRLRCWGPNETRELGTGNGDTTAPYLWDATATSGPETSGGAEITGWRSVAMGFRQGCGTIGGAIWCWGWTNGGALGVSDVDYAVPTHVPTPGEEGAATLVALGGGLRPRETEGVHSHACAIVDRSVLCWGDNDYGQLGLGFADAAVVSTPTNLGQ